MTKEAKSSIIQNVLASVIVQMLVLGAFVFIFYGRLEAKLATYDANILSNAEDHKEIVKQIADINSNGTTKGQPIYTDVADLKLRVGRLDQRDAANEVRLEWIMSSLERLERQNGLVPPPRPLTNSK